jgi:hypothetical protein
MHYRTDCSNLAYRMHFALRRWLGCAVDVQRMVGDPRYARDVLLVCDASKDAELIELARRFRRAARAAEAAPVGSAPVLSDLASHDCGSGFTQAAQFLDEAPGDSRPVWRSAALHWLSPRRWFAAR